MSLIQFDEDIKKEGYKIIAGVDEAGRGPLAGPVFAAAVIMRDDFIIEDINDSKKLSEKKREKLYDLIIENAVDYSIVYIDEKEIDEINILNATLSAMNKALKNLKVKPDLALIDGNQNRGILQTNRTVIKGDSLSYCIAAASILAKVSRDKYIINTSKIYPEYHFEKHKGYGTKLHIEAIRNYGLCDIHRKSFCKNFV